MLSLLYSGASNAVPCLLGLRCCSPAGGDGDSEADSRDSFDQAPSAKELLLINRMDLPKELQVYHDEVV
jgi:hypothetical protein